MDSQYDPQQYYQYNQYDPQYVQQAEWARRPVPAFSNSHFSYSPVGYETQRPPVTFDRDYDEAVAAWTSAAAAAASGSNLYNEYDAAPNNYTRTHPYSRSSNNHHKAYQHRGRTETGEREASKSKHSSRDQSASHSGHRPESSSRHEYRHDSASKREHRDRNTSHQEHTGEDPDKKSGKYSLNHQHLVEKGWVPQDIAGQTPAPRQADEQKEEKRDDRPAHSPRTPRPVTMEEVPDSEPELDPRPKTEKKATIAEGEPEPRPKTGKKVTFAEGKPTIIPYVATVEDEEDQQVPETNKRTPFTDTKPEQRPKNDKQAPVPDWPRFPRPTDAQPPLYRRGDLRVDVNLDNRSFEPRRAAPHPSGSPSHVSSSSRVSPPSSAPLPQSPRPKEPCATAPRGRPQISQPYSARPQSARPSSARPRQYGDSSYGYYDPAKEYARRQYDETLRGRHHPQQRQREQSSPTHSLEEGLTELERQSPQAFCRKRSDDSLRVSDGFESQSRSRSPSDGSESSGEPPLKIRLPDTIRGSKVGDTTTIHVKGGDGKTYYRVDITPERAPPSPPREEERHGSESRKKSNEKGKKRKDSLTRLLRRFER